jgi:heme/copper-type cytochrome/quinol oxidase subunit 3
MKLATDVLIFAAWFAALVFVARYARVKWFQTPMGIHMMTFGVVLLLLFSLASSTAIWGEWTNRDVTRLVAYLLINVVMWWRNVLLFVGQHRKSAQQRNDHEDLRT